MSWIDRSTGAVRLLFGAALLINGVNWFYKIITPYPSISDFKDHLPPPDLVGALIENGILFHMAKAIEVFVGLALLANRMVPLALVLSMAVTVPVFVTDVFKPEFRLRASLMGSGSLVMNLALLLAYYHHYRPMLAVAATASDDPATRREVPDSKIADGIGRIGTFLLRLLAPLATVMGSVMLVWFAVMIVQHAIDPKSIHEVRPLQPRPAADAR